MSTLTNLEIIKAIPHDISMKGKMTTGIVSRTSRSYPANNQTYSPTSNNCVTIVIPSLGWIDWSRSDISGILSWVGDSTTELSGSVHSLFRRVKITALNGQVLFDSDLYDTLASVLQDCTLSASQQQGILGITSLMNDQIRKTGNQVQFSFKPLISMLRSSTVLPHHLIGGFTLEMWLQDSRVTFKSAVDVSPQVSNVKYNVDVLSFDEQVEASYRQAFAENRLKYYFEAWSAFPSQSQSQTVDLRIETTKNSLDSLIIVPRFANLLVDKTANSYTRTQGSLFACDITCGTNKFNTLDLNYGNSEGLSELEKVLDSSMQSTIVPAEWSSYYGTGSKFCIAKNLNMLGDPAALSGSKGHIVVGLKHASTLANPIHYTSFVLHNVCLISGEATGTSMLS